MHYYVLVHLSMGSTLCPFVAFFVSTKAIYCLNSYLQNDPLCVQLDAYLYSLPVTATAAPTVAAKSISCIKAAFLHTLRYIFQRHDNHALMLALRLLHHRAIFLNCIPLPTLIFSQYVTFMIRYGTVKPVI